MKPYLSIRDSVVDLFKGEKDTEKGKFWALKDISFDVYPGESVGIIGKNGAGKSTLLKVLSKITPPTEGFIKARGRVASLLEVGTGFHPELSGRENIYLNGSILGLTRTEIDRKFDEIVDFSGVERFLDTALKHYSSGMQLRLAFAVAAHLEPEILVIDEVLAVGDAAFQKKCLGKMDEVSKSGRTILFVSHNMAAVRQLCQRGIYLEHGRVKAASDNVNQLLSDYLNDGNEMLGQSFPLRTDFIGNGGIKVLNAEIKDSEHRLLHNAYAGQSIQIIISYADLKRSANLMFKLEVFDSLGRRIIICNNRLTNGSFNDVGSEGKIVCSIDDLPLNEGLYRINVSAYSGKERIYLMENALELIVSGGDFYPSSKLPEKEVPFLLKHNWFHEN